MNPFRFSCNAPAIVRRWLLVLAASSSLARAAVVWDLKTDWSDAANPNGPWSLNEGANPLPNNVMLVAINGWGGNQPAWAETATSNHFLPLWYRSNGTEPFPSDLLTGDVAVHSIDPANGVGNGEGNVTWTSPISGTISIVGDVWMAREIGRSNDWKIYKNGVLLSSGSVSSGDAFNRANPSSFTTGSGGASAVQNLSVTIGDVIKLEIVRTSGAGDFVGINMKIVAGYVWSSGTNANGNTYIPVKVPGGITWQEAENAAIAAGGHLAGIDYADENAFIYSIIASDPGYWFTNPSGKAIGPWIGALQAPIGNEPGEGWQWSNGNTFGYSTWAPAQPDNAGALDDRTIFFGNSGAPAAQWADYPAQPAAADRPHGYVIEIGPSEGAATVWNNGPGANGHSYQAIYVPSGINWADAEAAAVARGGHLASVNSAEERAFIFSLVSSRPEFWYRNSFNASIGPWIGGFQPAGSSEPGGGWQWTDGSSFTFTYWSGGEPNNSGNTEHRIHLYHGGGGIGDAWNDITDSVPIRGYIIEFSSTPGVQTGPKFADLLYVASQANNIVYRYRIGPSDAPQLLGSLTDDMDRPSGLAVNTQNELIVVQRGSQSSATAKISRFTGADATPAFAGSFTASSPLLSHSHGADFLGAELLVVDSANSTVRRFLSNGTGGFTEQLPNIPQSGNSVRYLTVNPSTGEIFVSQAQPVNKILRFLISPGGVISTNGEITGNGLANPHGMTFSPWGELFVANHDSNSISRFALAPSGAATANGTISGNDLATPLDAKFSPWGELFVGNTGNTKVSRFKFSESGAVQPNGSFTMPTSAGALQFVSASAPPLPPPCVPGTTTSISDGLIGWWKGDGNANDFTGNNNGTEENGVTYVPGRFGQAFRVGAVSVASPGPRVNLGHIPQLKNADAITVSAWIKPDGVPASSFIHLLSLPVGNIQPPPPPYQPPGAPIMGGVHPSNGRGFYVFSYPATLNPAFISLGSSLSFYNLAQLPFAPAGQWNHLCGVWRKSDGFHALYINGVLNGNGHAPAGASFPPGIADLAPGYLGAFAFTSGTAVVVNQSQPALFDDVRIYTRDLSPEEIMLISIGEDFNTCPPANTGHPPLTIVRGPGSVKVSWPLQYTGWALESSPDMITWSPVLGTPLSDASDFSVTTPDGPAKKYFRLRKK